MVTNSTFSYASWCYSDQQTEWASDLGEDLLSEPPAWLGIVSSSAVGSAEVFGTASVLELSTAGTLMIEGGAVVSMAVAVAGLAMYPWAVFQLVETMHELYLLSILLDTLPDGCEPSPTELQEAYQKRDYLLNKYNKLIELYLGGSTPEEIRKLREAQDIVKNLGQGGPPPLEGDLGEFLTNLYRTSVKLCNSGIAKLKAGDIVGGMVDLTLGTAGLNIWSSVLLYKLVPKEVWEEVMEYLSRPINWLSKLPEENNTTSGG